MEFTYRAYGELLKKLREHGYRNWEGHERCVILRHDIDNDIEKAAELAAFEGDGGGIQHILCPGDIGFL